MDKSTIITVSNKSNIFNSRVFHVYRNGKNCKSKISFILKSSVRKIKPLKKKDFKKKSKIMSVLIRTRQWINRYDGSQTRFSDNSVLVLKKNSNVMNTYIWGPTSIELRRKKYLSLFKNVY